MWGSGCKHLYILYIGGLFDMPPDYTPEMAEKDGYYVNGYYNFVAN